MPGLAIAKVTVCVFRTGASREWFELSQSASYGNEYSFQRPPAQRRLHTKLIGNLLDSSVDVYYVRLWYCRTARLLNCWVHVGHHTSDLRDILPIRSLCVGCWRVCGEKMKD